MINVVGLIEMRFSHLWFCIARAAVFHFRRSFRPSAGLPNSGFPKITFFCSISSSGQTTELPRSFPGGADLPNGWRVTPAGKSIGTMGDLMLNLVVSPDSRIVVAVNSGFFTSCLAKGGRSHTY